MNKTSHNRSKLFLILGVFIIMIVMLIVVLPYINDPYRKTSRFVNNNLEDLQRYVNDEIELDQIKNSSFIQEAYKGENNESRYIKFDTGAKGFISNSCYIGFYYSEKDIPHKFEFAYEDRILEKINSKNFKVKEKKGDNILYVTKIRKHWYYFESCY